MKKILLTISVVLILLVSVIFLCLSPISKYLIEKYDVEFTGREITLQNVYVSLFTGCFQFESLKVYEINSDSVFLSAKEVSANFAMLKLITKTYEISELSIESLKGTILRHQKTMNFDDLITRFTSKETRDIKRPVVHFNILNINISNSEIFFRDENIPVIYSIKNLNVKTPGKRWDADTIPTHFSFTSGADKGGVNGDITVNFSNMNYVLAVAIRKYDLDLIRQYLKELTNGAHFSANVDADVKAAGNFNDGTNLTANGMIAINDFHFGKSLQEDYVSFKKLALSVRELSPRRRKYNCDSISLDRPYFKFEQYDKLNNLDVMFGKKGANIKSAASDPDKFNLVIEIAKYVRLISKNFFESDYKINRLAVYNGGLTFNDFSESEKFSMQLANLNIFADSIDKTRARVDVSMRTNILPYGKGSLLLSIDPRAGDNFDLSYSIDDLPITMFNPYIISHTSFPLDRGTLKANGQWRVREGIIQSDNHLLVIDPRLTGRVRNKDLTWLPMQLIMPVVRERGNVIEYSLPITGDMKSPQFHLQDVFFHVLENALVKPVTTRYRMRVKNQESSIEHAMTLKWRMRNNTLERKQERSIALMRLFLEKNPGASIAITPQYYLTKEKEYILFFEAKKKYYLLTKNRTEEQLTISEISTIEKMSVKDSLFIRYLNKYPGTENLHTIQEKCCQLVDSALVDAVYQRLNAERTSNFLEQFGDNGLINRIKFLRAKNTVPYNGFSFYQFTYEGGNPEYLLAAHHLIDKFNDIAPRKKFRSERSKIGRMSDSLKPVSSINNTKRENK